MTAALAAIGVMWASQLAPPTTFTVAATGDFLIHGPVAAQALSDGNGRRYDRFRKFGAPGRQPVLPPIPEESK